MLKKLRPVVILVSAVLFVEAITLHGPASSGSAASLLPPAAAILLALSTREVMSSLLFGCWLGASMINGSPWSGLSDLFGTRLVASVADTDHAAILLFSMILGAMVGVMNRSGGTKAVVKLLRPLASSPKSAQLVTWAMGLAVFFDDYSNTLIVGSSMRPVSDAHLVSREKLAFLVDSTAAPVATMAVVSTWVGYQVSLIGDALASSGSGVNPFLIFIRSIPYAFYPVMALMVGFLCAVLGRDFGPMLRAEVRAREGKVIRPGGRPLAELDDVKETAEGSWPLAAVPVLVVIGVTVMGLVLTSSHTTDAAGFASLAGADPFKALLWGSSAGLAAAVFLSLLLTGLSLDELVSAAISGARAMVMAAAVLVLAWSLGKICDDLGAATYVSSVLEGRLSPALLPALTFLVSASISFSTGSSWGTMAIVTPLAVGATVTQGVETPLLSAVVAAVLGGAVFGDHCSPISDTTIMSSMASGCDHIDHVRTQLPYAVLAAAVALLFGYTAVPLLGVSPVLGMVAGGVSIYTVFRLAAQRVNPDASAQLGTNSTE